MAIRDTDYKPVPNVALRSPLAIGGFFIHFLQQRFREGVDAPYIWRPDFLDTELFITSGGSIENELRNNRPALYVNIGSMRSSSIVVGDKSHEPLNIVRESSYTRIDMNMTINCETPNVGESHNLGWMVYYSIIAAQDVIRSKYHIANMGPFELIPPRPSKKDRNLWIATINFGLNYEITWRTEAVQTFIKEFIMNLELNAGQNIPQYLTQVYAEARGNLPTTEETGTDGPDQPIDRVSR